MTPGAPTSVGLAPSFIPPAVIEDPRIAAAIQVQRDLAATAHSKEGPGADEKLGPHLITFFELLRPYGYVEADIADLYTDCGLNLSVLSDRVNDLVERCLIDGPPQHQWKTAGTHKKTHRGPPTQGSGGQRNRQGNNVNSSTQRGGFQGRQSRAKQPVAARGGRRPQSSGPPQRLQTHPNKTPRQPQPPRSDVQRVQQVPQSQSKLQAQGQANTHIGPQTQATTQSTTGLSAADSASLVVENDQVVTTSTEPRVSAELDPRVIAGESESRTSVPVAKMNTNKWAHRVAPPVGSMTGAGEAPTLPDGPALANSSSSNAKLGPSSESAPPRTTPPPPPPGDNLKPTWASRLKGAGKPVAPPPVAESQVPEAEESSAIPVEQEWPSPPPPAIENLPPRCEDEVRTPISKRSGSYEGRERPLTSSSMMHEPEQAEPLPNPKASVNSGGILASDRPVTTATFEQSETSTTRGDHGSEAAAAVESVPFALPTQGGVNKAPAESGVVPAYPSENKPEVYEGHQTHTSAPVSVPRQPLIQTSLPPPSYSESHSGTNAPVPNASYRERQQLFPNPYAPQQGLDTPPQQQQQQQQQHQHHHQQQQQQQQLPTHLNLSGAYPQHQHHHHQMYPPEPSHTGALAGTVAGDLQGGSIRDYYRNAALMPRAPPPPVDPPYLNGMMQYHRSDYPMAAAARKEPDDFDVPWGGLVQGLPQQRKNLAASRRQSLLRDPPPQAPPRPYLPSLGNPEVEATHPEMIYQSYTAAPSGLINATAKTTAGGAAGIPNPTTAHQYPGQRAIPPGYYLSGFPPYSAGTYGTPGYGTSNAGAYGTAVAPPTAAPNYRGPSPPPTGFGATYAATNGAFGASAAPYGGGNTGNFGSGYGNSEAANLNARRTYDANFGRAYGAFNAYSAPGNTNPPPHPHQLYSADFNPTAAGGWNNAPMDNRGPTEYPAPNTNVFSQSMYNHHPQQQQQQQQPSVREHQAVRSGSSTGDQQQPQPPPQQQQQPRWDPFAAGGYMVPSGVGPQLHGGLEHRGNNGAGAVWQPKMPASRQQI